MSVLGILLHFGRAVIHAHNNAKTRNLMDPMPRQARFEADEEGADTTESRSQRYEKGSR
ncbi:MULTISPECIES: hypothetical protein [unclassified Mesorhizobium]|uniref:hypothetical protein n=1 Tax=unclassified Mesorhizobium TaxID=325217 RepID=UPI0015E494F1|nr:MULTISPECIES: hypothetical protein [unclassified Mesorhizobium]